jgi:hypothetical protein
MSDNTFIPTPLPGDPIPEPVQEIIVEEVTPLEGIQPEDTRPKGEDYIPEITQYLKRFKELGEKTKLSVVSDYVKLIIRNLDKYTRGEMTLEEIDQECPSFGIDERDSTIPDREDKVAFDHIKKNIFKLYKEVYGRE